LDAYKSPHVEGASSLAALPDVRPIEAQQAGAQLETEEARVPKPPQDPAAASHLEPALDGGLFVVKVCGELQLLLEAS
jgi:hypothetical protein